MVFKIDTEAKQIEVPKKIIDSLKRLNKETRKLGSKEETIFSQYGILDYELVSKIKTTTTTTTGDRRTKADIDKFMESKRSEFPELYEEYIAKRDEVVKYSKNNLPIKTDLFSLRSWVKDRFSDF
jgi:hypothetical protein